MVYVKERSSYRMNKYDSTGTNLKVLERKHLERLTALEVFAACPEFKNCVEILKKLAERKSGNWLLM